MFFICFLSCDAERESVSRHSYESGNLETQSCKNLSETAETERSGFPPAREWRRGRMPSEAVGWSPPYHCFWSPPYYCFRFHTIWRHFYIVGWASAHQSIKVFNLVWNFVIPAKAGIWNFWIFRRLLNIAAAQWSGFPPAREWRGGRMPSETSSFLQFFVIPAKAGI